MGLSVPCACGRWGFSLSLIALLFASSSAISFPMSPMCALTFCMVTFSLVQYISCLMPSISQFISGIVL